MGRTSIYTCTRSRPGLFGRAGRLDRMLAYLMILMIVSGWFPQGCFVSLLAGGCSSRRHGASWRLTW